MSNARQRDRRKLVKERPILMSGEMVRALLAGTKTQTLSAIPSAWWRCLDPEDADDRAKAVEQCRYGIAGDRLWVRETWYDDHALRENELTPTAPDQYIEYRADHDCLNWEQECPCNDGRGRSSWRPSIFMPRWASRITLEITGVRVERVQDISEDDARVEGIGMLGVPMPATINGKHAMLTFFDARTAYAQLWDEINGKRPGHAWRDNPWAWVVEFKVLSQEQAASSKSGAPHGRDCNCAACWNYDSFSAVRFRSCP